MYLTIFPIKQKREWEGVEGNLFLTRKLNECFFDGKFSLLRRRVAEGGENNATCARSFTSRATSKLINIFSWVEKLSQHKIPSTLKLFESSQHFDFFQTARELFPWWRMGGHSMDDFWWVKSRDDDDFPFFGFTLSIKSTRATAGSVLERSSTKQMLS